MERYHIPGAALSYVQGDRLVLVRGFGVADRETARVVTPDTPFRVASVSKPVTAAAVLRLIELHNLTIHTDVTGALAELGIENGPPITWAHLLTHTAGLEDRRDRDRFVEPSAAVPLHEYMRRRVPSRVRSPGELIGYSNSGYALLAHLVEQRSSQTFPEFMRRELFDRVTMTRSTFEQRDPPVDLAKGYDYRDGVYHLLPYRHHNTIADGALITTATDMGQFMRMLLLGGEVDGTQVLGEATVRAILARQFANHPALPGMGLGWYEDLGNGSRVLLHEGSMDEGFESLMFLIPEARAGLFVVYNQRNSNLRLDLLREFAEHFYPPPQAPITPMPSPELRSLAGKYGHVRHPAGIPQRWFVPRDVAVVVAADDSLVIVFDGGTPSSWIPVAGDVFRKPGNANRVVAFRRDPQGRPLYLLVGIDAYERVHSWPPAWLSWVVGIGLLTAVAAGLRRVWQRSSPRVKPRADAQSS